jgi:hypothetical protein
MMQNIYFNFFSFLKIKNEFGETFGLNSWTTPCHPLNLKHIFLALNFLNLAFMLGKKWNFFYEFKKKVNNKKKCQKKLAHNFFLKVIIHNE